MFLVQHPKRQRGAGSTVFPSEVAAAAGSSGLPTAIGTNTDGTTLSSETCAVNPLLLTPGRIEPTAFYSLEESAAAGVADFFDLPSM